MNPLDAMNAINDGRWADLNAWLENNPDAWPTFHASDDQSHGALMVPCGRYTNVMRVMPSLTIPRKLLFKALDVFGEGLKTL